MAKFGSDGKEAYASFSQNLRRNKQSPDQRILSDVETR